jgi:hypothetical protein
MTYGIGTRSFNRSPENRQMKRERAEFTAKYEAGEVKLKPVDIRDFMSCTCRSFRYPHPLDAHKKLRSDMDWRPFEQREQQDDGWVRWSEVR